MQENFISGFSTFPEKPTIGREFNQKFEDFY